MMRKGIVIGAAIGIAVGAALLLSACEKEIKGVGSEGKVALQIAVSHADFVEEGTPRGFDAKTKDEVLERVIIPVGEEEDYYLSVALKPDTEQPDALRGVPNDGQLITLAAFNTSTDAQVGSAVHYYYSVSANDLIPVTAGAPLLVDVDETYYIVAYSYNSTTTSPGISGIDPSWDLLWGRSADKYITESDRTVEINMAHLFSRVMVNIHAVISGASITDIGTVKIEGGKQAGLNLRTGEVTPGSGVAARDLTSLLTGSGAEWETDYFAFYPSPTKVTISSITVTINSLNYPFTALEADFTKTLEAGKSYVLAVELRRLGLANSNIYWDGTKLTFDKYPANPSRADYQGVYFKWGSLIGIDPENRLNGYTRLYIPNVGDGTWDYTKHIETDHSLWSGTKGYSTIPYIHTYGETIDPGDHANYKGDICSYLTGGTWYIPYEGQHWDELGSGSQTTLSGGTGMNGLLLNNAPNGPIFFPASGIMQSSYLTLKDTYGYYWTASPYMSFSSFNMVFGTGSTSVTVENNRNNDEALSIRCLKRNQSE